MERVKYDPEIDPTIREAREEAEREREMSARIRLEIERYVKDNELVPKDDADSQEQEAEDDEPTGKRRRASKNGQKEGQETEDDEPTGKRRRASKNGQDAETKRAIKAKRGAERRKAFQSVFTGSILSNPQIVKLLPYLFGVAVILVLYIANTLHLQTLHRSQQRLEEEIKEFNIKAVGYSAERAQRTQRSAIVRQLNEKGIPLYEFPKPFKTIDPK